MNKNKTTFKVDSYRFPLKGGPHNGLKYRIPEPLPKEFQVMDDVYVLTSFPERKLWPLMYVHQEKDRDQNRTSDSRATRAEQIRKALIFGAAWSTDE